jgi:glycosyltransferase involved in cell wall biosynthesis
MPMPPDVATTDLAPPVTDQSAAAPAPDGWVVMLEAGRQRWGGDLRRMNLFRRLAEITEATTLRGWGHGPIREQFGRLRTLPTPLALFGRRSRPRLASSEQLPPSTIRTAARVLDPAAVAIYDDPVAQAQDLGIVLPAERREYFVARKRANVNAFRWHVVPTASFAEHIGLDMSRVIVAGNGTDVSRILPGEWPEDPAIGMISGAAPGRGVETLIEAARLLHEEVPELRLLLWLAATGDASQDYLDQIRETTRGQRWIEISTADYADLTHALRQATVLATPHPPGAYHDIALPVKLLDGMAAGRPQVVTPRTEPRAVIERHGVGIVTRGERPEHLADSLRELILDPARAQAMGKRARLVAETTYDWSVVGQRVAEAILEREGVADQWLAGNAGGSTDQSSYSPPLARE